MFFCPKYYANNIFEINIEFYKKNNINTVLMDLDNTLDHNTDTPSEKVFVLVKNFKENNILPIIVSNNTEKKVSKYANTLKIDYLANAHKPFKKKILKKIHELNINLDKCIIIGDQIFTDIIVGNRIKIKTLLTNRLNKKEPFTTKIKRFFEFFFKKRIKKKSIFWENC